VFKTAIKHCRTCDICKIRILEEVSIKKATNKAECARLRAIQEEKIKEIQEAIKEDPFAMIRM
jgi:hypothetical protein